MNQKKTKFEKKVLISKDPPIEDNKNSSIIGSTEINLVKNNKQDSEKGTIEKKEFKRREKKEEFTRKRPLVKTNKNKPIIKETLKETNTTKEEARRFLNSMHINVKDKEAINQLISDKQ
jgi:hypothetical protein